MTTSFTVLLRSTLAFGVAAAATMVIVAGSAAPVHAGETVRTAVIDVRGIDRTTAAGAARIAAEIDRAARRVCSNGDGRALANMMAERACIAETTARTLPAISLAAAIPANAPLAR